MKMPKRSTMNLALVALVGSAGLVACGGGASGTKSDSTAGVETNSGADGASGDAAAPQGTDRGVKFGDEEPRAVTLVEFLGPRLALGFADGAVGKFDPATGAITDSKVAKVYSVAAVSPSGDLALLASNPPAIVNSEGELILQMNTVEGFESAVFGHETLQLYVADRAGKVRIWGQAHSFEEDQHKEKLENYLNRQAPDFHVEFPSVRGPIVMTPDNKLVVTDEEGVVRLWDPTRPSSSKQIMKLDGHARSLAAAEGYIYATSTNGALKIGRADGGYLPWTKDARGGYVAATGLATDSYWQLDDGALAWRSTQDGGAKWELKLPAGPLCGLSVSGDAAWLAACVSNRVVLVNAETGQAAGHLFRANDKLAWKAY